MLITITDVYKMYPYANKKDIKLVINLNNVKCYEEPAEFNWHLTSIKFYNKDEITKLFWW